MHVRRTIYCLISFVFDYLCDVEIMHILYHGFTNTGCQIEVTTKFCTVAPNIYVSSARNLFLVNLLAARILRNIPHFSKICALLFFTSTRFGCTMLPIGLPRRFNHKKMPNEIQNVHCTNPALTRPSRDISTKRAGCTQFSRYAYHDKAMDPRTHSK
jgi:hypothetical protein